VKLNEFKKRVVNEIDARSLFGDYGAAALKTGLGSMAGKNVLSTTDQMAKDDYITKFTSRALSGLQSAINGGLVDPTAKGVATPEPTPQPVAKPGVATPGATGQTPGQAQGGPKTPEQIRKEKQAAAGRVAQDQMAANPATPAVAPTAGKNVSPTPAQTRQQKLATATTAAQGQMAPFSKLPAVAADTPKTPDQIRQEKLAAATQAAQGQMTSKVAGPTPKTPDQIRQAKQLAATQAAQGQMNPVSKLPADQFDKSAANVRQQQQGVATQNAQDQMSPVSKLPADQFAKSADNVRQQQQTTATQTAQQQMAEPTTKAQPTQQQPGMTQDGKPYWDPATGKGSKYDGVTGETTPEWQKELDKQEAARLEKVEANRIASQAAAAERDAQNAELVRQGLRQNPSNVTNNVTQTTSAPNTSVVTTDPAEVKAAMKAKIDAMKEKNPKLAAQMADLGMDDEFDDAERAALDKMKQKNPKLAGMMAQDDNLDATKPDNIVKMPKRNVKPRNAGKNAFGQMAQNLGGDRVAEGSRFDKLNYIFESILAEQDPAQGSTKQTISQYITNFFKQFMKGVNISDPTVTANVASLAKELEQTYAKDKGKSTLPKLANLAYSVSYAQAEQEPPQGTTKTPNDPNNSPNNPNNSPNNPNNPPNNSTQAGAIPPASKKQLPPARQIGALLNKLNSTQKKQLLASLEKELGITQKKPATKSPTVTVGKQKRNNKSVDPADAQLLAAAKKQGKI
jgi:hypothetical protein